MRGNGRLNGKSIIVIGVIVFIIITAGVSLIPTPTGKVSGGFMMDGERVSDTPLFSFADPSGNEIDAIWVEMSWTVQGEDVVWDTFKIEGKYEIRLWNIYSQVPTVLDTYPILLTGEMYATAPYNIVGTDYALATLLYEQPFTNPADPTYWTLHLYGEFTASVEDLDGTVLSFDWSDYAPITVYWKTGTFTGSGSVSTG